MWVYGDHSRRELPERAVSGLVRRCERLCAPRANLDEVTAVLLDAGELAQGLLDEELARRGADDAGACALACSELLKEAGRLFCAASDGDDGEVERSRGAFETALNGLAHDAGREPIELKTPEGYAFYALYPEAYRRAAEALPLLPGRVIVIGIRSIGTSLGGVVAAALRTSELWTVRPTGDPFRRVLNMAPRLEQRLLADAHASYVVVDEGPGLSGSSFGAVGDWLEERGVPGARIHFIAGHGGPLGPHARPDHRARWEARPPQHRAFEQLYDERRVRETLFGAKSDLGEVVDLSGGRWREEAYPVGAAWPGAHRTQERRKFLFRSAASARDGARSAWLGKFVGLGRYGEAKYDRALRLHARGFIPEPLALRAGFLISRWEEAAPLDARPARRAACVDVASAYLAALGHLPATGGGASAPELFAMAETNIGEALGPEAALAFATRWHAWLPALAELCAPVQTDNRLHRWEWLVTRDERVLKADALDHHAAHDLVGCQDLAWDIAGLTCELDLDDHEQSALLHRLQRDGAYRHDPQKEAFFTGCYLAYQLGYYSMAREAAASFDAAEAARLQTEECRYRERLTRWLSSI